jgi:hypothetical protein
LRYFSLAHAAGAAVEDLLCRLCIPVSKAAKLNPLIDKDFVVLAQRLSRAVRVDLNDVEEEDISAAADALEADWVGLSEADREQKYAALKVIILSLMLLSVPVATVVLAERLGKIIKDTKAATILELGADLPKSPSARDTKTGKFIVSSQEAFTRREYERRAEVLVQMAREMVDEGLKAGLDSAGISALVVKAVLLYQQARSKAYWDVTANVLVNRARTGTQLNTYADAGVETARFVAVMDGATCDTCEFMNGRIASVASLVGIQRQTEDLTDPDDILGAMPWLAHDKNGIYFERKGVRHDVPAEILTEELVAEGLFLTPIHGKCRCRLEAVSVSS